MAAKRLTFLLGGARSGKSRYAENWAREHGHNVLFVATAQAFDDEMRDRIATHRADRPTHWTTLETPLHTGTALREVIHPNNYDTILIDCITLLAANALLALSEDCTQDDANRAILAEIDDLLAVYAESQSESDVAWLIVSNEVGMGIVPPTKLGRLYRDALGAANQRIAQAADEVLLLVAGLPWPLKSFSAAHTDKG